MTWGTPIFFWKPPIIPPYVSIDTFFTHTCTYANTFAYAYKTIYIMHAQSMYYPYPLSILVEILFLCSLDSIFGLDSSFLLLLYPRRKVVPYIVISNHIWDHVAQITVITCDGLKLPISYTPRGTSQSTNSSVFLTFWTSSPVKLGGVWSQWPYSGHQDPLTVDGEGLQIIQH